MSTIGSLQFNADELLSFSGEFSDKHDDSFLIDELILIRDKNFGSDFEFANKWHVLINQIFKKCIKNVDLFIQIFKAFGFVYYVYVDFMFRNKFNFCA